MGIENKSDAEKRYRAKKMMLWFGIISLSMTFAGLTSAFIVSSSRPDWVDDFQLPNAFMWSTLLIILSSLSLIYAKKAILNEKRKQANFAIILTFLLGLVFIILQFSGFQSITEEGYYFTGSSSNVTASYIYLIAFLHVVHIASGMIVLIVLIYNHFKNKYKKGQMLGFEMGATFWHFVDLLWLFLFFFFIYFLG
ncbi:cytochrome c oxidase subunit 3 [Psychroflexus planctonicus]|uniref:cytochrome-c oxidase n=1 Tax=Psychroflexus planctonicus TaxID=1526575 RepID=A0ABQ1SE55_9FLAO|nr:cytochrome c oxidase subunit 3 [Psychroflexus planctonicus]GGE24243.1 cytochrome oxidase subunit III [Psychroflexus planctonicus]